MRAACDWHLLGEMGNHKIDDSIFGGKCGLGTKIVNSYSHILFSSLSFVAFALIGLGGWEDCMWDGCFGVHSSGWLLLTFQREKALPSTGASLQGASLLEVLSLDWVWDFHSMAEDGETA